VRDEQLIALLEAARLPAAPVPGDPEIRLDRSLATMKALEATLQLARRNDYEILASAGETLEYKDPIMC
jgi:hypothetical protein